MHISLKRCIAPLVALLVVASAAPTLLHGQDTTAYPQLSAPRYRTVTEYDVKIPMRDGVQLAANVVRPDAPGRFPVVMRYWPYGKQPMAYFAERGYVTVLVEGRGVGGSGGVMADYFDAQSFRDGYDAVEWAGKQRWSTGKVGMTGISFGAINATRVAALRPPHLAAIAVNSSYANFYGDHWFPGGVRSNHPYVWHGVPNLLATMLRGPGYDDGKGGTVVDVAQWKAQVAKNKWDTFFPPQWTHDTYDAYWEEKDLRSKYADFAVPTLQVANYFDHARNHDEAYQNFIVLSRKRVPQKLIVGPWTHGGFGPAHAIDFNATTLAWFDRFLKGIDNGIDREAPVSLFVMRENAWRAEPTWPIARTRNTTLYLGGRGTLSPERPTALDLTPARFTYHPWVGSAAGPYGTWFNATYDDYIGLPDQRVDEASSLTFTSEPLAEDMEMTGMPEIAFVGASSANDTDWSIKLSDVAPDGKSSLVTRGWLSARFRASNVNPRLPEEWKVAPPTPITPGVAERYRVTLQTVSYRFRKGERIRVTIASSDWPSNWPNPNAAENEIRFAHAGEVGVSSITLPIVPAPASPLPPPRLIPAPRPPSLARPSGRPNERFWIEDDLSAHTIAYRSEETRDDSLPGGAMRSEERWRVELTREAPYRQVIDYQMTMTLRRPGQQDLRFIYRVRTDEHGPKATVTFDDKVVQ